MYARTSEDERGHLAGYLNNPSARLLIARDDEAVIGVGIGTLFSTEETIWRPATDVFHQHPWNPTEFFYIGEMIFTPEYRNRGIGRKMLGMLKKAGTDQRAKRFCFLAVERDADDPRRPSDDVDSEAIFRKFCFRKTPIQVVFDWSTIMPNGSVQKIANTIPYGSTD